MTIPFIEAIPALSDNYIWAIRHADARSVTLVDPGSVEAAESYLQERGYRLANLLITHHHADHIGAVADLQEKHGCRVLGPAHPRITPLLDDSVTPTTRITLAPGLSLQVLSVPAHTLEHVAYYLPANGQEPGALFCGDTLFMAGCGRLFEGDAHMLDAALQQFMALPDNTRVCCAHEYTLSNLRFAAAVEPDSVVIQKCQNHCQQLREQNLPTLPSTLAQERQINPFLRTEVPAVIASASAFAGLRLDQRVDVLAALRRWKDQF